MMRFWRHVRGLWPGLGIVLPLPFLAHTGLSFARAATQWESAGAAFLVVALFVTSPRTKRVLLGVYPIALVGLLYDAMRVFRDVGVSPQRVHLCDLRAREIALFGVSGIGERTTVHDWLQAHASPMLDRLCAIPYGTFFVWCVGCAAWLYVRDYARMERFGWCFLALNLVGFATYHLYPAAPPWYYHAHGCAVDVLTPASSGPNLARVDAWLGVPYFAGLYGRSSAVFGAMPSLHCAYPLLVTLEGWAYFDRLGRSACVAFCVLMCFAAVYLDHHWVLDVVGGLAACLMVVGAARLFARQRASFATPRNATLTMTSRTS
jgi:membrane-associated phospholipid phosphatase